MEAAGIFPSLLAFSGPMSNELEFSCIYRSVGLSALGCFRHSRQLSLAAIGNIRIHNGFACVTFKFFFVQHQQFSFNCIVQFPKVFVIVGKKTFVIYKMFAFFRLSSNTRDQVSERTCITIGLTIFAQHFRQILHFQTNWSKIKTCKKNLPFWWKWSILFRVARIKP